MIAPPTTGGGAGVCKDGKSSAFSIPSRTCMCNNASATYGKTQPIQQTCGGIRASDCSSQSASREPLFQGRSGRGLLVLAPAKECLCVWVPVRRSSRSVHCQALQRCTCRREQSLLIKMRILNFNCSLEYEISRYLRDIKFHKGCVAVLKQRYHFPLPGGG